MEIIKVIALVGQAGSGKSEVAQHLISNHGFILYKFAETLKDMLRVLGLSEEEIEGNLKETPSSTLLEKTPRHAMQTLGTEWGRNLIHTDLWAHAWGIRVLEELEEGRKVVCDDCRFLNEVDYVRSIKHSQLWRIKRKMSIITKTHQSEMEQDQIVVDRTLRNNGTLGELKTAVDGMILSPRSK